MASWGRILAATGSIPLSTPLDPTRVSVSFVPSDGSSPLPLLVNGEPEKVDEARASEIVGQEDLEIRVELGLGNESAKYWTCDFSYVGIVLYAVCDFNAHYAAGVCEDQRRLQDVRRTDIVRLRSS
jgi:N-acetylglutamate synthase/N-acetylornithine aminotransferase